MVRIPIARKGGGAIELFVISNLAGAKNALKNTQLGFALSMHDNDTWSRACHEPPHKWAWPRGEDKVAIGTYHYPSSK